MRIGLVASVLLLLCGMQLPAQQKEKISVLNVMDITNGECVTVKEFPYLIEAPNWTPDGQWLVYNSDGKLFRIAPDGKSAPEQIETGEADRCNNDHVISSDGKQIGLSHSTNENGHYNSFVYIVPFKGGEARRITKLGPSYLHGWSPDMKTMVYCAFRGDSRDVYSISVESGEEKQLTTAEGLDDGPEFSPDGSEIWFNSVRSGLMQAWKMKADGSQQTQMTFDTDLNAWFPHISPDGQWVVYIAYHKGDVQPGEHLADKQVMLRLMPAKGGTPRTIRELFGGQGTINVNSWAPDSRRFAFVSYKYASDMK